MRLLVVLAVIVQLQRFWVCADPKSSQKETPNVADKAQTQTQATYKADQSWVQRGFLSSSNSQDYAPRYQPRTPQVTEDRHRPQEYAQYQTVSEYVQRQEGPRHTCFQSRPESGYQSCPLFASQPEDSKYITKAYREFKTYTRPESKYNSIQSPPVNAEGYQVVNEDPAMHMAVVSPSEQYSQPQVITIRDNGRAYTSQVSQYRSQEPPMTYEHPEASRGATPNERYMQYASPQDQQPEVQYKYRMPKSAPYVDSTADSSRRMEVLSNHRILGIVNQ